MKKDKEWLKNEIEIMGSETSENYPHEQMVDREEVLNLIDQLDEPEKVVIPKFVADWIEEMKQDERPLYNVMSSLTNKRNHEWNIWKRANMNFSEIVAQAWLDGYEVKKEKLYYVKLPNTNSEGESLYLAQGNVSGDYWFNSGLERLDYEAGACKHQFTEKEIKDYDQRFWSFAVEVTE